MRVEKNWYKVVRHIQLLDNIYKIINVSLRNVLQVTNCHVALTVEKWITCPLDYLVQNG